MQALRRHRALCEAEVQSISLAFGFLPTAGGWVRGNKAIAKCTWGPRHSRGLTSSWNICSSMARTFTEGGCCTASKGNCRTHLMFLAPHFCPPPTSHPLSSSSLLLLPRLQFLYCSLSQRYSCPAQRLTGMLCTSVILPSPPSSLLHSPSPLPAPDEKVCSTCSHHPPWAICLSE